MKTLCLLVIVGAAILGRAFWQADERDEKAKPIVITCPKELVCTSANTTTKPKVVPASSPVLVTPNADVLLAYIEKHCRVIPGGTGAVIPEDRNRTIGQIKCDQ